MPHCVKMFVLAFMELERLLQVAGEIQQVMSLLYDDGTQQMGNVDL